MEEMVKRLSDTVSLFSWKGVLYPAYSLYGEKADASKRALMLISAVRFRTALPCRDVTMKITDDLVK